jgi:predicted ATP-grasp superfamily ATP-dependent carboligase
MAISPDPSSRPAPRVPVLLLGGVNLVRTLGQAGIPAVVASADADEPAFASRYCVAHHQLPPFDRPHAVDRLIGIGERLREAAGQRVPLMYGSDDALELIYAHRNRLRRHFRFLVTDPAIAGALIAKDRFQALAQERGLPVPPELAWDGDGPGTLAAAAREVLVKPRVKVDWHDSALHTRVFGGDSKARIYPNGAAVLADPAVALFREQLTFQDYIPGGDAALWSFHGYANEDGALLASFVGRKIRTDPPLTGESAFIELAHDDSLAVLGRDIAARLPLKGPFKMDFKRDPRDGRWYILEINARYNLWHYLGAANGVNLMAVAYGHLLGHHRRMPQRPSTTWRWLSLENDWRSFRVLRARGELGVAGWLASIALSRNVYNLFAWRDPGPWLRFWARRVARRAGRGSSRLLEMVRQWRSTAS